jgi:ribosome modulation factor
MKRARETLPPIAAELLPYYWEGRSAAAAGLAVDTCRYTRQDRRSAWLSGYHSGALDAERPEPPTPEQAAAARPQLARLREIVGPVDDGAPGWRALNPMSAAHWMAEGKALCRGAWMGAQWGLVPEDHPLLCGQCESELALRQAPRMPLGPARRREIAEKLKALGVDAGE